MPSIFFRIIAGEIPCHKIWEDDRFIAFLDIRPIRPGHVLLVPKQEIDYIFDLDDETYRDYFIAAKRLAEPLRRAMKSRRVGMMVMGLDVPHAHIHLVPISEPGDLATSNAKAATQEELAMIAEKIRGEIDSK